MRHVGVLMTLAESDPEAQVRVRAFREGLRRAGWIEGRNVHIDYRWVGADPARYAPIYAAELAALKPDVLLTAAPQALAAAKSVTQTIPIVFAQVPDPVGMGFVASLARPGGNVTGFTLFEYPVAVKWLELLKQIAPQVTRVGVLYLPTTPSWSGYFQAIEAGVPSFGVQLSALPANNAAEIERALEKFGREPNGGVIVLPNPLTTTHRGQIIELAERHRLPTVYPYRFFATSGGLASYGVDNHELYRRAASYVDRILKGEKPGDLPVQQSDRFELLINLRSAKALGLEVPITLLARTDEVIE